MICVVCADPERPVEPGWLVCFRDWSRMATGLRDIPGLVAEVYSLGLVQRDRREGTRAVLEVDEQGHRRVVREPGWPADPVAMLLPTGPINGARSAPRVSGSRDAPVPIRIDPTDLTGTVRPAATAVHARSPWPADQIGHLSVATELDFWASDWAAERNESRPSPQVPFLCSWLSDRLDWAGCHYPALDEFAGKLSGLYGALTSAVGGRAARPETLLTPCRSCGTLALYREVGPSLEYDRVACGACPSLLTEGDYAEYARSLGGLVEEAKENAA